MLLTDYPSIREEDFPDYAKDVTWNLLHAYIDRHSQILLYEYRGFGVKNITLLQYQCTNMTFSEQIRYHIIFQQVTHK